MDSGQSLVVDRTMRWDAAATAATPRRRRRAATTWYLAEGATHGELRSVLPAAEPERRDGAASTSRYLRPAPPRRSSSRYTSRRTAAPTIWGRRRRPALLADATISAVDHVATRADHRRARDVLDHARTQPFARGPRQRRRHRAGDAAGSSPKARPGRSSTCSSCSPIPTRGRPRVDGAYLLPDGAAVDQDLQRAAATAATRSGVDDEDPGALADTAVSTIVDVDQRVPIIVERTMWWPARTRRHWSEAHNSPGATATGTRWALAEGEAGGAAARDLHADREHVGVRGHGARHAAVRGRRRARSEGCPLRAEQPRQRGRRRRVPGVPRAGASARSSRASARRPRRSSSSGRCTRTPAASLGAGTKRWRRG